VRTANSTADALMAGRSAGRDRGVELSHSSGIAAALFDRDGTLVEDVPYNGDPAVVRPVPGARAALDRLRAAGLPPGVVSNQSGVARGLLTREQVARVEELLGVPADRCVVVGDIGADVAAGRAAGARAVPVPTAVTRAEEVATAPVVAGDLGAA
jgi:histidinol phosphatase-like enzyme